MSHQIVNPPDLFNSVQYGFSQAVVATGTRHVFLSGQVAVDQHESLVAEDMFGQALAALENIRILLRELKEDLSTVTMLRIYIREDANTPESQDDISKALAQVFGAQKPASSWVIVSGLTNPRWLLEIEAQAVLSS